MHTNLATENFVGDRFLKCRPRAKPFLKWAGGKRQLLAHFNELYPLELTLKKIKNYYDPFVGGGAVFFDVAQHYEIENAYLYDINDDLILAYKVIQKEVYALMEFLHKHAITYKNLSEKKQKEYYYKVREKFNRNRFNISYDEYAENWLPRAAQIIFLNKTCFNGLFRFNAQGAFNSPQGRYKNPTILDEQNLISVSKLLGMATIKKADFKDVKNDISSDSSFVYFDPPYRPISATSSFTAYSKFAFEDDEQKRLAKLFYDLDRDGHRLMLSNSDPKNINPEDNFFETMYSTFNITRVDAKRSINSNAEKRTAIKEIVVTNYWCA